MTASYISLPTDLLATFRRKLSAFFASEAGGESFARRPVLGLTLVVPGEPEAILEIRPTWCRWFKKLDTSTLAVDLLVNRLGHEQLSLRTSYRPVEFGITLNPDGERISRRSLRYGDEGRERLVEVVAAFLADPATSLARSKDRCCLCRRKLTDGTSVLRGYGPECARKIGTLLGYFTGKAAVVPAESSMTWDFASLLSQSDDWAADKPPDGASAIEIDVDGDTIVEGLGEESEPEAIDPLDRYFNPEAGLWCVESHGGQLRVVLPWVAETPLDIVLDDAMATIAGCIEDGLTDDDDTPITDYGSFVVWKGPDVAAVAIESPTDSSRLEFTFFGSPASVS